MLKRYMSSSFINGIRSRNISGCNNIVKRENNNNIIIITLNSLSRIAKIKTNAQRNFSTTRTTNSHIGRAPILYPPEVTLTHDPTPIKRPRVPSELNSTMLTISGPLGTHTLPIKPYIRLNFVKPILIDGVREQVVSNSQILESKLTITVEDPRVKEQKTMWGTTRALIANYVIGVSEGFQVPLRLVGVGYRANMEEARKLVLRVGFAHPVELEVPEGITCHTPSPTRIVLSGTDWREVKQFAANIRKWRKPEPYNQKGIFVGDETIKKKLSRKK
ncbi:13723_t:CDS:1 [Ambispora leptoticha]|uniref:13723_t:CDS:1 n=1 Tax=Ambispora leptoticha TaxID=144679 RepID=A0A9N9C9V7_9GLOM|nr:13723_t:CDS:1 [Ambispora leptoticha]